MKKSKTTIILVLVFLVGLSVMLYPAISDYWNSKTQSRAVAAYNDTVSAMDEEDYDAMFARVEAYNEALHKVSMPFVNYDQIEGYEHILDVSGTGIMGYVTIKKIHVELPIYHGTARDILQIAAGHLEGSSLPAGGESTHCVLSAHRGLPSAKLFTNLDEMEEGDTFTITVLDRTMTYQVDQIRIVEPEDVSNLAVEEGKDYCTLMTCTPYGVNSHRMLVRGVRTAGEGVTEYVQEDAYQIHTLLAALVTAIPMLFILLATLLLSHRRRRQDKKEQDG